MRPEANLRHLYCRELGLENLGNCHDLGTSQISKNKRYKLYHEDSGSKLGVKCSVLLCCSFTFNSVYDLGFIHTSDHCDAAHVSLSS